MTENNNNIINLPDVDELNKREKERIERLNEEIKERKERDQALKCKEAINNNKILDNNGIKAYGKGFRIFCIFAIIGFWLLFASIAGFAGWLVYSGHLNGFISATFNATINNDFKFDPVTTNNFDNKFNNNINQSNNYNFVLSDAWLTKICAMCNSS